MAFNLLGEPIYDKTTSAAQSWQLPAGVSVGSVNGTNLAYSWKQSELAIQRAIQKYISDGLKTGANTAAYNSIQLPPAQTPYPFKPIPTILDPNWLDRYKKPEEEKPEPKPAPVDDDLGGSAPYERDLPFAWEDWGPLQRGTGMTPNGEGFFGGFKSAINNAKIGLATKPNFFGHPIDDPGWQAVMDANNMPRDVMESYFSMPGEPRAMTYQEVMKQDYYAGMPALDEFSRSATSKEIARNATHFDSTTGNYSFDRASYMGELARTNPDAARSVVSVNNARATETMLGAMALNAPGVKNTPFATVEAYQAMPSYAYDVINAFTRARPEIKVEDFTKDVRHAQIMEDLTYDQLLQYVRELSANPEFAKKEVDKITSRQTTIDQIRQGGLGAIKDVTDKTNVGVGVSEVTKERLGIDKKETFGAAINEGKTTVEDIVREMHNVIEGQPKGYDSNNPNPSPNHGDGKEPGSDGNGGNGGNSGGGGYNETGDKGSHTGEGGASEGASRA